MQFSQSYGRGPRPESPFTWSGAPTDTLPRGASRASYSGGSLSPTSASQLPPPSPSSRKGAAAAAAARGIDALLLNNGQPAPAAHAGVAPVRTPSPAVPASPGRAGASSGSGGMFSPAPVPRHLEFMQQELDSARTASAALPAVPPTHDAAAIRAAAAELAERISAADQSSATSPGPPRFSQLRAVTPQPAATSKQQESNVLALKLTVVAGPSTDTSYVTAKDTKQVTKCCRRTICSLVMKQSRPESCRANGASDLRISLAVPLEVVLASAFI